MTERKWKLHSSQNCFGKRSEQVYVKEGLVVTLYNRAAAVKQYQKSEKNWKR